MHQPDRILPAMNSPLKALERLSEEAKQERLKNTSSLQENVRLKIQIENLKVHLDAEAQHVESLETDLEDLRHSFKELEEQNDRLGQECGEKDGMIAVEQAKTAGFLEKEKDYVEQANGHGQEVEKLKAEIDALKQSKLIDEATIKNKDAVAVSANEEISRQRKEISMWEAKFNTLYEANNDAMRSNETLKIRLAQTANFGEQINAQEVNNKELRQELESVLVANHNYQLEINELNRARVEGEVREEKGSSELRDASAANRALAERIEELELVQEELSSRIRAETEVLEHARSQADVAARGREFVDAQVKDLKLHYETCAEQNRVLEEEMTTSKLQATHLQSEIIQARDRITQLEGLLQKQEGDRNLNMEIEYLRGQLNDMRKRLIKKDMQDAEAGGTNISSKAILEREQSNRAVYEGIIADLRSELEKLTVDYHDSQSKYEGALKKCSRVDQMEEEVKIYKECLTSSSMESTAVQLSYNEVLERSEKSTHEKQLILRDLKTVEIENENYRVGLARLQEELQEEKVRFKKMHVEKLAAERRCSELLASKSKSEAVLDGLKQGHDTELLELERLRRGQKEVTAQCAELRRKLIDAEDREQVAMAKLQQTKDAQVDLLGREQSLKNEVALIKSLKGAGDKELSTLNYTIRNQTSLLDQNQSEIRSLKAMIEDFQLEREKYRKDVVLHEQSRTELQLSSLRSELEQTVTDWRTTETSSAAYSGEISALKLSVSKEVEKTRLLRTQIALLEDRLKVSLQELSVYRSLDVYHSSAAEDASMGASARSLGGSGANFGESGGGLRNSARGQPDYDGGSPKYSRAREDEENLRPSNVDANDGGGNISRLSVNDLPPVPQSEPQGDYSMHIDAEGHRYEAASEHDDQEHQQEEPAGVRSLTSAELDTHNEALGESQGRNHGCDRGQVGDAASDAGSVSSLSSLQLPPRDHPNYEAERRRLRAERERRREKLMLMELSDTKPQRRAGTGTGTGSDRHSERDNASSTSASRQLVRPAMYVAKPGTSAAGRPSSSSSAYGKTNFVQMGGSNVRPKLSAPGTIAPSPNQASRPPTAPSSVSKSDYEKAKQRLANQKARN